ncbi:MAG: hypothetical protein HOB84_00800 [Candidatus Marinimicrobia bacterium]|jgi:hypothetical protein|nr:hypothetical protein [Candidatus Neomarinimicrobiota bacterium]MBT4362697.1 hypothetical protein [Candidatus Neomarinimicrobiota bacterium]MBT4713294.1 hypothetical protein [Candidatus Neomarinimicrobiota bacterium]MBT4944814.1 hypothetical protein [Candidatus Neomarinimicrobiota bacterium]MBT5271651.1 hypothetical protein [Candidatus Neomarinimicrobiota bacterium]
MLVAVLMVFVIFSFTGVAVLNVSYLSSSTSMETVQNIKLQYEMESKINEALWRINTGVDSIVNYSSGGTTINWDSQLNILSVGIDNFNMESEVLLDLSEDTHFDRALASDATINTNNFDTDIAEENSSRFFTFMPEVDLDYFTDNAVAVHSNWFKRWDGDSEHEDDEAFAEGIHIFTGSFIELKDMELNNCTLVFTGRFVFFSNSNHINAPVPVDSSNALPALVFTNPDNNFYVAAEGANHEKEDVINGAIYTAGTIILKKGELSGPIVGKTINLEDGSGYAHDIRFRDTEHPWHYRWQHGFKEKSHYDWPKRIGRWRTAKWAKKHSQA